MHLRQSLQVLSDVHMLVPPGRLPTPERSKAWILFHAAIKTTSHVELSFVTQVLDGKKHNVQKSLIETKTNDEPEHISN